MRPRGYAIQQLQSITNLPTLPTILYEILAAVQDPDVDFGKLKQLVYRDPALVSRILRIANSAFYGRRSPTSSIETAFLTLGLNEVIAIISSVGVVNAFANVGGGAFDRRILWKHSLMTGMVARYLAKKLELQPHTQNEEFIAGLLHDLGHIVILEYFPEEFGRIYEAEATTFDPLQKEEEELGCNHAEISGFIADRWRFSPSLTEVLRWHHEPEKSSVRPVLTRLIHFSDRLASWRKSDEHRIDPSEPMAVPELLGVMFPGADRNVLQNFAGRLSTLPEDYAKLEDLTEEML